MLSLVPSRPQLLIGQETQLPPRFLSWGFGRLVSGEEEMAPAKTEEMLVVEALVINLGGLSFKAKRSP